MGRTRDKGRKEGGRKKDRKNKTKGRKLKTGNVGIVMRERRRRKWGGEERGEMWESYNKVLLVTEIHQIEAPNLKAATSSGSFFFLSTIKLINIVITLKVFLFQAASDSLSLAAFLLNEANDAPRKARPPLPPALPPFNGQPGTKTTEVGERVSELI